MLSLKVASVGGDRLLSSDVAIVPVISGNSVKEMIFRAKLLSHRYSPLHCRDLLNTKDMGPFPFLVLGLRPQHAAWKHGLSLLYFSTYLLCTQYVPGL